MRPHLAALVVSCLGVAGPALAEGNASSNAIGTLPPQASQPVASTGSGSYWAEGLGIGAGVGFGAGFLYGWITTPSNNVFASSPATGGILGGTLLAIPGALLGLLAGFATPKAAPSPGGAAKPSVHLLPSIGGREIASLHLLVSF